MRTTALHLVFHSANSHGSVDGPAADGAFRFECFTGTTGGVYRETVQASERLGVALKRYRRLLDAADGDQDYCEHRSEILEVLSAWIGRLLWDDFFAWRGEPNAIGRAVLNALVSSRQDGSTLRLFLHLDRVDDTILPEAPWPGLLFRWAGTDASYHSLVAQPNVHVSYLWSTVRSIQPAAGENRSSIRVLLTFGGQQGPGDEALRLYSRLAELVMHAPQCSLVNPTVLGQGSTVVDVDVWVHVGHGHRVRPADPAGMSGSSFVVYRPLGGETTVTPYDIDRLLQGQVVPLALWLACGAASPGTDSDAFLARRALYYCSAVVGFAAPVGADAALRFGEAFLEGLRSGHDAERAVAAGRKALQQGAAASPIHWQSALPVLHVTDEAPAAEFDILGELDDAITSIEQSSTRLEERHRAAEQVPAGRLSGEIVEPEIDHGPSIQHVLRKIGLSGDRREVEARPLVLLGNAGSGKTVLLHRLYELVADDYRDERKVLPVLLSCRELDPVLARWERTSLPAPAIYLALAELLMAGERGDTVSVEEERDIVGAAGHLERLVGRGRVAVLLDGLDEQVDLLDPRALARWQEMLAPLWRDADSRVVISCRTELVELRAALGLFPGGQLAVLDPWREEQIREFLARQQPRIEGVENLLVWAQPLLATPLFASLAVRVLKKEPPSRALLLAGVVDGWAAREAARTDVTPETLVRMARDVAFAFAGRGRARMSLSGLQEVVDAHRISLANVALHSLVVVSGGMAHLAQPLLAKFLAALFLADQIEAGKGIDAIESYRPAPDELLMDFIVDLLVDRELNVEDFLRALGERSADVAERDRIAALVSEWVIPLLTGLHLAGHQAGGAGDAVPLQGLSIIGKTWRQAPLTHLRFRACEFEQVQFLHCAIGAATFSACEFAACTFIANEYATDEGGTLVPIADDSVLDEISSSSLAGDQARPRPD